uniref:Zinc knuckle CX2CX4HX4C domain-containing protein n=1 Tax=Nelumbo nucifera TaxID=4432 RepID=A0A822Z5J8_NELNU|nr:TPA_asm: hypothetical protein HUJ06_012971 [Nelumbo nucifera]
MDISQPLPQVIPFTLLNGETINIGVQYERLPRFCTFCASIGHEASNCRLEHKLRTAIDTCSDESTKEKLLLLDEGQITKEIRTPSFPRGMTSRRIGSKPPREQTAEDKSLPTGDDPPENDSNDRPSFQRDGSKEGGCTLA